MEFDKKKVLEIYLDILEKLKNKKVNDQPYTVKDYNWGDLFDNFCEQKGLCWLASNEKNACILGSIILMIVNEDLQEICRVLDNYNQKEENPIAKIEFFSKRYKVINYGPNIGNEIDLERIVKRALILYFEVKPHEKTKNLFSDFLEVKPIRVTDVIEKLKIFMMKIN